MPHRMQQEAGRLTRPWVLAGVVVGLVFFCEMSIMLVVAWWDGFKASEVWLALIDATVLSVLITPVVWLLLVRPIDRLAQQRGALLGQLYAAQDRERARLAQEMHDELGQGLTAILLGLRAIDMSTDLAQARQRAEEVSGLASGCITSVRRLAQGLTPQSLADFGLGPALARLVRELNTDPRMRFVLKLDEKLPRLSALTEQALFRIVQESLTNVVRHADASRAVVTVWADEQWVHASVVDNGVGLTNRQVKHAAGSSMGVRGMSERAESLGGWFTLLPAPGGGAAAQVQLPRTTPHEPDQHTHPDR